MRQKRAKSVLLFVILAAAVIYTWTRLSAAQTADVSDAVSYNVLKDDMGSKIVIGVQADITRNQLCATLIRAADEHKYDAARDYLFSDYLWVEARLVSHDRQSAMPAARLRRYVPPRNPSKQKGDWLDWLTGLFGKRDKFYITLEDAKRTLQ